MNINLSIKEKVAQKLMFGVNSNNIDIIINLIKNYSIGGVILYRRNYTDYNDMLNVIKRLKEANKDNKLPLFIAIDQEGGRVNRMPLEINNLKNIYDTSKNGSEFVYENAMITGKILKESGINMNLAPVLDICEDNKSKILYKRCFCGDISEVSEHALKYIDGMNENGIISVVKHYPGHGISKLDSHFITPYVSNYKEVLNKHIIPFDNMINSGVDVVMVSHLIIRKMTKGMPASISKCFIDKYIRNRNNYSGLIITDEINMLSRNILYRFNYMKKAFLAGSDIILIKSKNDGVNLINKFVKLVSSNLEYQKNLDESINRIIDIKSKYNINDNVDYNGIDINIINNDIEKFNKLISE